MELKICLGCMKEKQQPGPCPYCGFDENTYEPSTHHLLPGTILSGKYLVGRVLGEGGFGITYVGWDLNLEMKVAIKEYYPNGMVTRDHGRTNMLTMFTGQRTEFFQKGLNQFVDEARRLAKLWGLPGIVFVKDYFQENKTAYIVMEFAEGETLKSLLKRQPGQRLPVEEVCRMMRPVMKSLEKVHQLGLIHRDISPDNLMIGPDGLVRLIDFGATRDYVADGERSLSVMLKPGYAPEEQYRSRGKQGPWTDIYGLCATIYRAITGEVPLESLDRMAEDTLKPPSQLGVAISPAKEAALMKGLAIYQKDRYATVEALEEAFYAEDMEIAEVAAQGDAARQTAVQDDAFRQETADTGRKTTSKEAAPAPEITPETNAGEPLTGADTDALEPLTASAEQQTSAMAQEAPEKETEKTSGEATSANAPGVSTQKTQEVSGEGAPKTKKTGRRRGVVIGGICAAVIVIACVVVFALFSGNEPKGPDVSVADREAGESMPPDEAEQPGEDAQTGDAQADSESIGEDETGEENPEGRKAVVWADEAMEYYIRKGMNRPEGDIYEDELKEFRVLRINMGAVLLCKDETEDDEHLTAEQVGDNIIESLSDLAYFPNLTVLSINYYHHASDIDVLKKLTKLTELDLFAFEIENANIDALSNLTALTKVDLSFSGIENIDGLRNLTELTELDLNNNHIKNIDALKHLTKLTELDLRSNSIENIDALKNLTALTELCLENNAIKDISALSGLVSLENLYLSGNHLTDINALSELKQLEFLEIGNNNLTNIEALSGMTELISLSINANNISDIQALSGLTKVSNLYISSNNITDVQALSGLTNLKKLYMSNNNITDLSPLSSLEKLEELWIENIPATDYSCLDNIENLEIND